MLFTAKDCNVLYSDGDLPIFIVHSSGIGFRAVDIADMELLHKMVNTTWYGRHRPRMTSLKDQLDWWDRFRKDDTMRLFIAHRLERCDDSSVHGVVIPVFSIKERVGLYRLTNIDMLNRSAVSDIDVFDGYMGKGFGFKIMCAGIEYAFNYMNLYRLNAEVLTDNLASQSLHFRLGFVKEGVMRESYFRNGVRVGSIMYGLLVDEWKNKCDSE